MVKSVLMFGRFFVKEQRSLKMKIIIFKLRKYNIIWIKKSSLLVRTFHFLFCFILEQPFVFEDSQVTLMSFLSNPEQKKHKNDSANYQFMFSQIVSSPDFILLFKIHVKKL